MRWYMGLSLLGMFLSMPAMAEPLAEPQGLDGLLDAVVRASEASTCEETERALNQIPQDQLEAALANVQALQSVDAYQAKFHRISELSLKCPKVHDAFANRLSRGAFVKALKAREGKERAAAIESLKLFALECEAAIEAQDCVKAAAHMQRVAPEVCASALVAFQSVSQSSLNEEERKLISDKLERVVAFGDKCAEFGEQYRACLYSKRLADPYLPLSTIEPFLKWLAGVQKALSVCSCHEAAQVIRAYDPEQTQAAKAAISGFKPVQFSPADREQIRERMRMVYMALPECKEAKVAIDEMIESMFE